MKKIQRLLLTLTAFCSMALTSAQMTPRSVVTTAPEKMMLTLDASTLLDLLDYYESGSKRALPNKLHEEASITEMSPSTITVVTGVAHDVSFVILPYGKSNIIMAIDRVATPETDARISFYDSKWKALNAGKLLTMPSLADWTGKLPADKMRRIENALPFLMVDARYNPDNALLTLTPQIGDFVSVEDKEEVTNALADSLVYKWNGKSFKPLKK